MKTRSFNVIGYDTRYWWLLRSGGILFIGLGLWIIFSPQKTYLFLSLLLSIGMLSTGLFEAFFSLFNCRKIRDWGWIFSGGIIDLLLGIYLLNYPMLSMVLMPLVIGIWMLFRGFMTVSSPISLKALGIKDWVWLLVTGKILVLPSLMILISPFVTFLNMVVITGIAFLLSGVYRIYFSQQLRKLKTAHIVRKRRKIS